MIEMFTIALLAFAQPLPAITCAEEDENGACVYDYSRKPVRRVHALHSERVAELYHPYFRCYYERLTSDPRFGTSEAEEAIAAMKIARTSCAESRESAEVQIDQYLAERKIYGDASNREFVRELFRSEAGGLFVFQTARMNGRGTAFETMAEAVTTNLLNAND